MISDLPPIKPILTRGTKFALDIISSRDGLIKSTEARQGGYYTRRLPYYEIMAEKKDK